MLDKYLLDSTHCCMSGHSSLRSSNWNKLPSISSWPLMAKPCLNKNLKEDSCIINILRCNCWLSHETDTHTYVRMHARTHTPVHTHTHTHACTYAHTHTIQHTDSHSLSLLIVPLYLCFPCLNDHRLIPGSSQGVSDPTALKRNCDKTYS